ncbi:MAG: lipopolysaccharide heptosyltransferase II [Phycisphaerales bacterium]|nr:lipopolysaccharide heptosyltransferase II [Phycisphaerales bacterium]MCB9856432.1 lipopolysaccharide heptosyltransferase II [Phycisphaerales bacterium]MCB9864563.1 lipopolysaccharide heptosyltransferase II [Phycisphaerales bacterium]
MNDLVDRDFRRILLIKPSSPGDIIHALPVLRGLRRRYPKATISWLIAKNFVNMLEAERALDEIIPFDRKHYGRLFRNWPSTRDFFKFVSDLRRKQFDLVVDLQGLIRSGFLAWSSGARVRVGFQDAREMAWMFYTHRIPRDDAEKHAAERNFDAAALLGVNRSEPDFRIAFTQDDSTTIRDLIRSRLGSDQRFIAMATSTRWPTKCWPVDRFGQLAAELHKTSGLKTLLVGGPGDRDDGRRAADAADGAAVNVCGETTLRQLAALIDRASLVVTADSTPMHLAAAHGCPLVALFGPTNPVRTGPFNRSRDVVRLDLDCSPCYIRKLRQCPHKHRCMQDLSVAQVAAAAISRLDGRNNP